MRYSFVINDDPARDVVLRQLRCDMLAARLSLKYQAYYRLARPLLPLRLRQWLHRRLLTAPDNWYLPDAFIQEFVESIARVCRAKPLIHPWPAAARFAFVLTHDVETADGFHNMMRVANLEDHLGLRSSFNLVAHKYDIDIGVVRELTARGFEIGIHGYNHDGFLYASRRIFDRRATYINAALRKYGAVGFRSPMVHRNLEWLQALDIEYDASCFDIDPFQAVPGGVGGLWPFIAGRFVELPYTLPQDHTLFIVLREADGSIWDKKLRYVVRHSGMALMLTHPDYLTEPLLEVYREFLERAAAEGGVWHALPREVARWWRARDQSSLTSSGPGQWTIEGPAASRGVVATVG